MPTTPSATTTVNAASVTDAVAVAASSTVNLALASTFGVRSVSYTIVGNSSSSLTNPTITLGADYSASFTMPSGSNQGYLIETKINNGRDELGRFASGYKFRFVVGVVGGTGIVPVCLGERTERGTYGWLNALNSAISALPLLPVGAELTISSGSVTATDGRHSIAAESGTADDLLTISGGTDGQLIIISPASGDTISVTHGAGNIRLNGAYSAKALTNTNDRMLLHYDGSNWVELCTSYGSSYLSSQAGTTYTLTVEDCNRAGGVVSTSSSATEFTIDSANNYPTGAMIGVSQMGTGALTVGTTGGDTLNGSTGTAVITLGGQRSAVVLWQRASGAWDAIGDYS